MLAQPPPSRRFQEEFRAALLPGLLNLAVVGSGGGAAAAAAGAAGVGAGAAAAASAGAGADAAAGAGAGGGGGSGGGGGMFWSYLGFCPSAHCKFTPAC